MIVAMMAFVQAGSIGLFSDYDRTSCNLLDQCPGGYNVFYAVRASTIGAMTAKARAGFRNV